MGFRTVRIVAVLLVAASTLLWSPSAHAKAETLKRSVSNILQAPLDFALMPYTSVDTLVRNYYMSKRTSALEKVMITPVIGVIYLPSCVFASGFLPAERLIEGVFMLPVGVATAGTDADIYLYDPVHGKRGAVVDEEPFYFGARYCEGFFK
jgi:hypothetical protein